MPAYTITHYGNRFFALYSKRQCATDSDGEDLLAVTLYKKGAQRLLKETCQPRQRDRPAEP